MTITDILQQAKAKLKAYAAQNKLPIAMKANGTGENSWFTLVFSLFTNKWGINVLNNTPFHFVAFPVAGATAWIQTALSFAGFVNAARDTKAEGYFKKLFFAGLDLVVNVAKSLLITTAVVFALAAATVLGGLLVPALFISAVALSGIHQAIMAAWNFGQATKHFVNWLRADNIDSEGHWKNFKNSLWATLDHAVFAAASAAFCTIIGGLMIAAPQLGLSLIATISAGVGTVLTVGLIGYITGRTVIDIATTKVPDGTAAALVENDFLTGVSNSNQNVLNNGNNNSKSWVWEWVKSAPSKVSSYMWSSPKSNGLLDKGKEENTAYTFSDSEKVTLKN